MYQKSNTRSTGRAVPVPFSLMKYSLSALLLILSMLSVTRAKDYIVGEGRGGGRGGGSGGGRGGEGRGRGEEGRGGGEGRRGAVRRRGFKSLLPTSALDSSTPTHKSTYCSKWFFKNVDLSSSCFS